ncbi:uncharacterized protein LOC131437379 [Malaya genurostris]|uniref:uncharacterized protein LOC131437379 n=1 Tax=Malaya genurostris TaxID=325434 RepID=UPI0026F3D5C7|nr:uncharacterized protein LOC131437379 [Malaya genurostris]XP_058462662.1 uncharacterized protein LOC131437379 [Malaya genurostris]XP_058462663.1 uncharacterized protein LOC131437379 [Malaya genurostris]
MESICDFGFFDDFPDNAIHPLQIDIEESEQDIQQKLIDNKTNIYKPAKGETLLHRAIRSDDKTQINALIGAYCNDYDKVRDYLVLNYQWDPSDKIWLRKSILVAVREEHCKSAKQLENRLLSKDDIRKAVFILLQSPVQGDQVAVIHPDKNNRLAVFRLISNLIGNGFLSFNNVSPEVDNHQTFMEIAASYGRTNIIDRLFELGVDIAIPEHNALLAAFKRSQENTIRWLLTKHFDHFDCTIRDNQQYNALTFLLQMRKHKLIEFVLHKMIAYRVKFYNETESEAFNEIFRFENKELSCLSILTFVGKGHFLESIEQFIVKYKLNLSYQWENVTILQQLLSRKIALQYCLDEIRKNPQLLGLVIYGNTILQDFFHWGYIDFLMEIYKLTPEVKKYFETDGAFTTMRQVIYAANEDALKFMLENHCTFLKSNTEKLSNEIGRGLSNISDNLRGILMQYFPELQTCIEEAYETKSNCYYKDDIKTAFPNVNIDFSATPIKVESTKPMCDIRGVNGETLIHLAVEKNDAIFFSQLLETGCDLDAVDNDGNHAVHYISCIAMLDLLTERHPEGKQLILRKNYKGCSVLHRISSRYIERKTALLERVINDGVDVNQVDENGESALFVASSCNVLNVFLEHGVELDIVNHKGETAFLRQVRTRHCCMVRALLSLVREFPSFKEHAHEYLPFMMTSRSRDSFYCDYQWFLEKYPDTTKLLFDSVFEHSREEASRLFATACYKSINFVVEKFLDYDYDLDYNFKDDDEYSPIIGLLSYMEEKNDHLVKRLLEKGVDLEMRNNWGRNALLTLVWGFRSAKWYGHSVASVQLLVDHGANVNAADNEQQNTALHYAFSQGELELVEILVENGANLKARNNDGKMPYQMGSRLNEELFYFMD